VIAVARGTYNEPVDLNAGVAIYGACATETVLTGGSSRETTLVLVTGAAAEIHDLSIRDVRGNGIFVDADTSVLIEGIEISSVEDAGIVVLRGEATLNRVSIRDVAPRSSDGSFGVGIAVEAGATATIAEYSALRCHLAGILVHDATAAVTDAVVRDGLASFAEGDLGFEYYLRNGADATFARVASVGGGGAAIAVIASTATFEDAWLDGQNGNLFASVVAIGGADVTVSRARVGDTPGPAFAADGSALRVDHAFVHNSSPDIAAQAISVSPGGLLQADRMHISGMAGSAMRVEGPDSSLVARDIVIDGVRQTTARDGVGTWVHAGGGVILERVEVRRASSVAVLAMDASTVSARDLSIEDMVGAADGTWGRALHVQEGSTIEVERLRADGLRELAVSAFESDVILRDAQFLEIVPNAPVTPSAGVQSVSTRMEMERVEFAEIQVALQFFGGEFVATDLSLRGGGVQLAEGSVFTGHRVDITGPARIGVAAYTRSTGTVSDLHVASPVDPGHGIVVSDTAALSVERFSIEGAPVCGVYILGTGSLDLREGEVHDNTIGACVEATEYDLSRLTDGVRYEGNSTSFDGTTALPVPVPTLPFDTDPPPEPPPDPVIP